MVLQPVLVLLKLSAGLLSSALVFSQDGRLVDTLAGGTHRETKIKG